MTSSNLRSYIRWKHAYSVWKSVYKSVADKSSMSIEAIQKMIADFNSIRNTKDSEVGCQKESSMRPEVKQALEEYAKENVTSIRGSYFSSLYIAFSKKSSENEKSVPKWKCPTKAGLSRASIDSRTRHMVQAIAEASSPESRLKRLENFCVHLQRFPESKHTAFKKGAVPLLLRLRGDNRCNGIGEMAREALALMGYNDPVKGWGIRLLSIDGGGTRGIATVEILRKLEELTGKPINQLFDFICGVSTGAILAMLIGPLKKSMDESEEIYRTVSAEAFKQSSLRGTSGLLWSHSYYNTQVWVDILKNYIGDTPMICTARDPDCPKIAAVSTVINVPNLVAYVFRNYDVPVNTWSRYLGGHTHCAWEAVRASAAAPGYFEEFRLGEYLHQDGGILMNNPSGLAIHECQNLWPSVPFQSVVSCGTGRVQTWEEPSRGFSSLKTKLSKILDSATDTEAVHSTLHDLLPGSVYFRLNPHMPEMIGLDEIRPEVLEQLKEDTRMYLRRNETKLKEAAKSLVQPKGKFQFCKEWLSLQTLLATARV